MGLRAAERFDALRRSENLTPFRYRDFRILWTGAFFSFFGSWIHNVAQGWLVYELTHDEQKLAMVSFCSMAPVAVLGIFAGTMTDTLNRRNVLALTQVVFAFSAFFMAVMTYRGLIRYEHILILALINGTASAFEMPTRQSVVSRVVPPEVVSRAVPLNAMTFNLARVVGPALGGLLLARFGAQTCFFVNGLSYAAIIIAALAIKADLRPQPREPQPIMDLLLEGMLYTWRDLRLRSLFLMECTVSAFALFYLPMMPAIAKEFLHLDKAGLGYAMTSVGVGAIIGLLSLTIIGNKPYRVIILRVAMLSLGFSVLAIAVIRTAWLAFPVLAIAGAAGVMQFNVTNTLFQLLSPDRLRGRVLSMHIWALSGIPPVVMPALGWMAKNLGLQTTLLFGGTVVLFGCLLSWIYRERLNGIDTLEFTNGETALSRS